MQRFYKPVLLRWRHPQKQGDSFPDWWLLNGRHQNGLGHPNLNRIGIYVKWDDGYSLGWQKHGFCESWSHCVPRAVGRGYSAMALAGNSVSQTYPKLSPGVRPHLQTGSDENQVTHAAYDCHRKDESLSDPSAWKWLKMASRKESFPV